MRETKIHEESEDIEKEGDPWRDESQDDNEYYKGLELKVTLKYKLWGMKEGEGGGGLRKQKKGKRQIERQWQT